MVIALLCRWHCSQQKFTPHPRPSDVKDGPGEGSAQTTRAFDCHFNPTEVTQGTT
uniref:Uncharacterized protein n=1 Tax=Anguilla anguilla TaxID=7936 RepID=A0A0E9VPZ1_ANGAN